MSIFVSLAYSIGFAPWGKGQHALPGCPAGQGAVRRQKIVKVARLCEIDTFRDNRHTRDVIDLGL